MCASMPSLVFVVVVLNSIFYLIFLSGWLGLFLGRCEECCSKPDLGGPRQGR